MATKANVVKGDIIRLTLKGDFDVIVQGCNCFNTMGAGFAKQVKKVFAEAWQADQKTRKGDRTKLGTITYALIEHQGREFYVINAYTQFNYGREKIQYVDYDAVRSCFKEIAKVFENKHIAYPKIGCGLAGGDWNVVSNIINEELEGLKHTHVEL